MGKRRYFVLASLDRGPLHTLVEGPPECVGVAFTQPDGSINVYLTKPTGRLKLEPEAT